jgi:hypothetical protein
MKRSKRVSCAAAIALVGALSVQPVRAAAPPACPPSAAPIKLSFNTITKPPTYNHRLTLAGVAGLAGSRGSAARRRTLGLTSSITSFDVGAETSVEKVGNLFCTYVTSVDVNFGWNSLDVYVPIDFPQGSCEYRAILDHENQHVANLRATLREFAPRARARLEDVLSRAKPAPSRRQNGGGEVLLAPVRVQLNALLREFNALRDVRDSQIDNPSNYAAVTALCKNWDGVNAVK